MYQTVETDQEMRHYAEMKVEQTIRGFLSAFEGAGIPAVIMRNVEYIPSIILDRGDIDIAIPKDISEKTFLSLVADYGLIHWVWKSKNIHAYFKITDSYILRVDFQRGAGGWIGAEFYTDSEIFSHAHRENGFWVADQKTQILLKWFPSILLGGYFKDRYSPDITAVAKRDPVGVRQMLTFALGPKMGARYFDWAINGTPERSANVVAETRRAVRWTALRRAPVETTSGLISHFWQEVLFRLKISPSGISLAIIGPDGSGKTTICSQLIEAPYQNLPFLWKAHRRFSFPGLTPLMRKGREKVTGVQSQIPSGPHEKIPHSLPIGLVRLTYTVARSWVTEFSWARHRVAKNNIVIYDRHLVDLGIDPLRFRFDGPSRIPRFFSQLAPQPDMIILLDAPAEIVHPRKREVPISETKRQRQAYLELVNSKENAYVVDAGRPIDELVEEVTASINSFMMSRTRIRLSKLAVRGSRWTGKSPI